MRPMPRRAALLALAPAVISPAVLSQVTRSAVAAGQGRPPTAVAAGAYALPDGQARVAAVLAVTPGRGASPGMLMLDVVMTRLDTGRPVARYETELGKQVHLIAVSGDLRTFLHVHGDRPEASGHFRVPMAFPHAGVWHVYADAVPAGLGQQVMRFDLDLGGPAPAAAPAVPQPTGLEGADGRYGVRFDALGLRGGEQAVLRLRLLRDGQPAPDVTPYLGVAAHAVFIGAGDLAYVHAHAASAAASDPGGTGAAMTQGMLEMPGMGVPEPDHAGGHHAGMPGMGDAPLRPGTKVPPDLTLHVRAPRPGTYLLWVQFMAGGQVRTVPFVVTAA